VVEIPQLQGLLRYICENGFEHHVAANFPRSRARPTKQSPAISAGRCTGIGTRGEGEEMAIVAGVDFGTLSVRVSLVDSSRGLIGSAIAEYPLHRNAKTRTTRLQSHEDHMRAWRPPRGKL